MSGLVAAFAANVPPPCRTCRAERHGCGVDLDGCSPNRTVVDMDCPAVPLPKGRQRCDYLFVGEEGDTTWVAPIELKSGDIGNVNHVLRQLEGGATTADVWLPQDGDFEFMPLLAHGKGIDKRRRERLRRLKVSLRGKRRSAEIMRCGSPLLPLLVSRADSGV